MARTRSITNQQRKQDGIEVQSLDLQGHRMTPPLGYHTAPPLEH